MRRTFLLTLSCLLAAAASAQADTTLRRTIVIKSGTGYVDVQFGPGQPYVVRSGGFGVAHPQRAKTRRSILFFGQLTDPQIVDEESRARIELAAPGGPPIEAAWRAQEAFSTQVFDLTVRALNAARTSPVRQGNGRR